MNENFQREASETGRAYERQVEQWLTERGFVVLGRNVRHESGVEFDIFCRSPFGDEVGVECKASKPDAKDPGMKRSDNLWKVLGYIYALGLWEARGNSRPEYQLFTSDLPVPGSRGADMLNMAQAAKHLRVMHLPWRTA